MNTMMPDIYFLPEWGKFFETKERDGEQHIFEFKGELGHVFYQFIVRPIPVQCGETIYYDTITPYGFSGPIILECEEGNKSQLVALFDEEFQNYCNEHRIVTEYVRFNPWMKNRQDFEKLYDFRDNGQTFYIDLTVKDFFMDEFASSTRNNIRKAVKNNVEIEFDYTGKSVGEFHRLYNLTAKKHGIEEYYLFSEEFLQESFKTFKGKQFLLSGKHEGRYVSSTLITHHGDYMHYHLAANDPEAFHLSANSLVIHEACRWGVENGKKELHLGGAGDDRNLYRYKRKFTRTDPLDLLMGKRIHNQLAYDQLVQAKLQEGSIENPGYFPLYRG